MTHGAALVATDALEQGEIGKASIVEGDDFAVEDYFIVGLGLEDSRRAKGTGR